jgi:hypothetical protein
VWNRQPVNPPSGCRFHTRCWLRQQLGNPERCETERPEVRELTPGHGVACHFAEELDEPTRRDRLIGAAAASSSGRTVADEEEISPPLPPSGGGGGVFDLPGRTNEETQARLR